MTTDYRALCAELLEATQSHLLFTDAESTTAEQRAKRLNDAMTRARTALAQPEPVGPTDQQLLAVAIKSLMVASDGTNPWREDADISDEVVEYARAVLARWGRPAITPIPVSERLPGPEDCDAEGRCWYFSYETVIGGANWQLFTEEEQEGFEPPTHWLPFHALPLPEAANTEPPTAEQSSAVPPPRLVS